MKTILRTANVSKLMLFQQQLREEGIESFIRNENDPAFFPFGNVEASPFCPELCIIDDDDYERAVSIIARHSASGEELRKGRRHQS